MHWFYFRARDNQEFMMLGNMCASLSSEISPTAEITLYIIAQVDNHYIPL